MIEMESLGDSGLEVLEPIFNMEIGLDVTPQQTPVFMLPSPLKHVQQVKCTDSEL